MFLICHSFSWCFTKFPNSSILKYWLLVCPLTSQTTVRTLLPSPLTCSRHWSVFHARSPLHDCSSSLFAQCHLWRWFFLSHCFRLAIPKPFGLVPTVPSYVMHMFPTKGPHSGMRQKFQWVWCIWGGQTNGDQSQECAKSPGRPEVEARGTGHRSYVPTAIR